MNTFLKAVNEALVENGGVINFFQPIPGIGEIRSATALKARRNQACRIRIMGPTTTSQGCLVVYKSGLWRAWVPGTMSGRKSVSGWFSDQPLKILSDNEFWERERKNREENDRNTEYSRLICPTFSMFSGDACFPG